MTTLNVCGGSSPFQSPEQHIQVDPRKWLISVQHTLLSIFSGQTTRSTTVVEQIMFTARSSRDHTLWGSMGHLSKRMLERTYRIETLVSLGRVQEKKSSPWIGCCQKAGIIL